MWLRRQQRDYRDGNLLFDRETMLHSIGIKINVSTQPKRWLNNYELLKEYVTEKGDLPAAITEYKGVRLGRWLIYQKQAYDEGKLSTERIDMLKSVGFNLDIGRREEGWLKNYGLLKEYVKVEGQLPKELIEYKGVKLGLWLRNQRQAYDKGILSSEREALLTAVGVKLDIDIRESRWLENYELLKEYIKIEGRLPKELTVYKGVKLGMWLKYQRKAYDKGILSSEREDLLTSVGVKLDIDIRESRWLENYELLKEYIEIEERLPKELTVYKGVKLGMWLNTQKQAYKRGNLSSDKENLLHSIGITFNILTQLKCSK